MRFAGRVVLGTILVLLVVESMTPGPSLLLEKLLVQIPTAILALLGLMFVEAGDRGTRPPVVRYLVVVVAAGLLTPVGRRLVSTGLDVVDGSLLVFALRRALGLDTTTRRQRRIARRHAAEQAELERRIGIGSSAPVTPSPVRPTRLVASGEAPTGRLGKPTNAPTAPRLGRRQHALDVTAALGLIVLAIIALDVLRTPTGGVLGTTGAPGATDAPAIASPSPPSPDPSIEPSVSPTPDDVP